LWVGGQHTLHVPAQVHVGTAGLAQESGPLRTGQLLQSGEENRFDSSEVHHGHAPRLESGRASPSRPRGAGTARPAAATKNGSRRLCDETGQNPSPLGYFHSVEGGSSCNSAKSHARADVQYRSAVGTEMAS